MATGGQQPPGGEKGELKLDAGVSAPGALDEGSPTSHVDLKKSQCPLSLFCAISMSILKLSNVGCRIKGMWLIFFMSINFMSHVDFKKLKCPRSLSLQFPCQLQNSAILDVEDRNCVISPGFFPLSISVSIF